MSPHSIFDGGLSPRKQAKSNRPKGKGRRRAERDEPDITHRYAMVAGVTDLNGDGSNRQEAIGQCQSGEPLDLVPEPDNPHDKNAIAVYSSAGKQIGYLDTDLAQDVLDCGDEGSNFCCYVTEVTGGDSTAGKLNMEINIVLLVVPPDATDQDVEDYLDSGEIDWR